MDITLDYFEKYRSKIAEKNKLYEEQAGIREKLSMVQNAINVSESELAAMRQVITKMVETGMDPVEVKLRRDVDDKSTSFWEYDSIKQQGGISTGITSTALQTALYPYGIATGTAVVPPGTTYMAYPPTYSYPSSTITHGQYPTAVNANTTVNYDPYLLISSIPKTNKTP